MSGKEACFECCSAVNFNCAMSNSSGLDSLGSFLGRLHSMIVHHTLTETRMNVSFIDSL